MFGGVIITVGNNLIYYQELKKLDIIENPKHFPLNEIKNSDHSINTKYNGLKLNFSFQNLINNHKINHNQYNPFDMMNIVFINSNRADWYLCYAKQTNLIVGVLVHKHKTSDYQIATFLNSMHYQIKQCFIKSPDIPLYILTMKCHLIFHKLLQPNNCASCFSHKNPSSEYKEYMENDKVIEIEMNKLLDKDAISTSTAPPSYSKIATQKSDMKQHSLKLSTTHPPSYNMNSMYDYQQLTVKQDVDSNNDHKSVQSSETDVEEEKYSVTYSDSYSIIPQERYSSSDVIAAPEELKFKQHLAKGVINERLKKSKISKKQAQYELKKAYHTDAHTYNVKDLEMNYDTSLKYGLSSKMVEDLLFQYGPNENTPPKQDPMCLVYMKHVFCGYFNILIWFATIFCYTIYGVTDNIYYCHIGIVFSAYIFIILFYPFCKPHHDDLLGQQPIHFVTVTRDGILQEIDSRQLVPGDIVELKQGMSIAADMRIFECSTDLKVDNSSLTGESEPQQRNVRVSNETPAEALCLCFRGTLIVSGSGRAVVISTGDNTFFGRTAQLSCSTESDKGPVFIPPKFERVKFIGDDKTDIIESLIDNIFADLENLFYLLSDLTYYFMFNEVNNYCDFILNGLKGLLSLFVIYPFIIVVSLLIVLPSCFVLLIFRFNKIEMDSLNVAVRQKIIEYESCIKRCFRLIMQLIRSTFMTFILFAYPLIVVYVIIPNGNNTVATISIGSYLCIILLLQVFGTYRAIKSFQQKKKIKHKQCEYKPKTFQWSIGSIFTICMILFEINQMVYISYSSININSDMSQITSNETLIKVNNTLKKIVSSLTFLRFTTNIDYYMAFCTSSVGLLLIIFVFRFIFELRHYAYLKRTLYDTSKARDFYFYSFIGTIIYGHGYLKDVSVWTVKIVSILCDFLFLIICEQLILILVCIPSTNTLLIDSNEECWNGKHKHFAAISLILLSFYINLSSMVSPIFFNEENKKSKQSFFSFDNSIEFVKPYISVVTVTKCFMLFSVSFMFNQHKTAQIICNLLCSFLLIIFTLKWTFENLYDYGLSQNEPIFPFSVCLLRIFGFCCVIIGCLIESLKLVSIVDESCDFILLLVLVGMLAVIFTIATKRIHSKFNQFDDINQYNSKIIRYHDVF